VEAIKRSFGDKFLIACSLNSSNIREFSKLAAFNEHTTPGFIPTRDAGKAIPGHLGELPGRGSFGP